MKGRGWRFVQNVAVLAFLLGASTEAWAQNTFPTTGSAGVGTTAPSSVLEVKNDGATYWVPGSNNWNGLMVPPQALTITNNKSGGYDAVLVGRMATSTGTLKTTFSIGAVGTGPWSDATVNTQTADLYFLLRDAGGLLKERMRIDSQGRVGIGTPRPAADLHVVGDVVVSGNIAAKYQDVAEWVKTPSSLPAGTVVVIDSTGSGGVLPAAEAYDARVAGVVSDQPGVLLGEGGADKAKIAHSGRVKVKVDAAYGTVAVGDLLVTSPTPGYAMRSTPVAVGNAMMHRPGTLLGKALEPITEGQGEILVLLILQ